MARMSDEDIAHCRRATERAKLVLKPGDRITFTRCPGTKRWGIFVGWDGAWIETKTLCDVAAYNISKINGVPVTFRDE